MTAELQLGMGQPEWYPGKFRFAFSLKTWPGIPVFGSSPCMAWLWRYTCHRLAREALPLRLQFAQSRLGPSRGTRCSFISIHIFSSVVFNTVSITLAIPTVFHTSPHLLLTHLVFESQSTVIHVVPGTFLVSLSFAHHNYFPIRIAWSLAQ